MARRDALTKKQAEFVKTYLSNGGNGAAAYRGSYGTHGSAATIQREAHRLTKNPKIAPMIAAAEEKAQARVSAVFDQYAITKERIARELALLGFSNMLDYIAIGSEGHPYVDMTKLDRDKSAAISHVVVEEFVGRTPGDDPEAESRQVRKITFKLADKRQALVDLAKLHGMLVEKREHAIKKLSELSDEELEMLLHEATGEQT